MFRVFDGISISFSARWRPAALSLALVCLSHVLLSLLGVWSQEIINDSHAGGVFHAWQLWNRWDAPHYLDLARHGYSNHGDLGLFIVFFPGYPAFVRMLEALLGDTYSAALWVSFFSVWAAAMALHHLVSYYRDTATADRAIWYLLFFPSAYFFHLAYTEALFLATLLWLWLGLLQQRWLLVAGLGLLLCATRINGMLIGLVIAAEVGRLWWQGRRFDPQWFCLLLVPLGLLLYLAINQWMYDSPFHFLKVQADHWHKSPGTPLTALSDLWGRLQWEKSKFWMMGVFELAAVVLAALASLYAFWRLSFAMGLWSLSNLILMTSTGWALSLPRYLLVIFPLFILLADLSKRPLLGRVLDAACLIGFSLFAIEFARGRWAF